MNKFKNLGVIDDIIKSLKDHRIDEPTEIQIKAIPIVVAGHDLIAGSATGSGKTLAFAAAIIKTCERKQGLQALVLTPTRELAVQVSKALHDFSKYKQLKVTDVYGGVSFESQVKRIQVADVVVATPGRLLDHVEKRTINLSDIKVLVIDEADRMFDMGFIKDIRRIIDKCPTKRQTLLFSATITDEVSYLSKKYMHNPQRVSAEEFVDPKKLKQVYYDTTDNMKISLLVHLLKKDHSGTIMVFCNTKSAVNFVARNLKNQGIMAQAIHGGFTQAKRSTSLENFQSQKVKILVCTDVAARGLDIKGVSHVYNYNIPKETKQYVHRIGRTARAGKNGIAVNLLVKAEHFDFGRILKFYKVDIEKMETPEIDVIKLDHVERRSRSASNHFTRTFPRGRGGSRNMRSRRR
ncbi:MAG: DEAD/DEAH box helicase [Nanoarchaeota archaeon]|nr:DEAD/DEAH box helicase [Nanoarchaeota archaeon]